MISLIVGWLCVLGIPASIWFVVQSAASLFDGKIGEEEWVVRGLLGVMGALGCIIGVANLLLAPSPPWAM